MEGLGDLVEAEADLEFVLVDLQVPELVLKHDRDLFRVPFPHGVGQHDTGVPGVVGDVEMVVAHDAALGDMHQGFANDIALHAVDFALRLFHQLGVADPVF